MYKDYERPWQICKPIVCTAQRGRKSDYILATEMMRSFGAFFTGSARLQYFDMLLKEV
jgi:hypothetical protein